MHTHTHTPSLVGPAPNSIKRSKNLQSKISALRNTYYTGLGELTNVAGFVSSIFMVLKHIVMIQTKLSILYTMLLTFSVQPYCMCVCIIVCVASSRERNLPGCVFKSGHGCTRNGYVTLITFAIKRLKLLSSVFLSYCTHMQSSLHS